MMKQFGAVIAGFTLIACATSGQSSSTNAFPTLINAGRDVLTAAEIVASRVTDSYQAVAQLRPEFLRRRSAPTIPSIGATTPVTVYLDEVPYGGVESLRSIPLDRVRMIRYIPPFEADLRWGGTHPAGAIVVKTLP
jgi:hypothetical protein